MKRLTLAEARKQIEDRELWLWRQKNWSWEEYSDEGYDDGPDQGVHQFDGGFGDGSFF